MSTRSSSSTPHDLLQTPRSRAGRPARDGCTSACMAGSKRSRSLSWIARHSVRLRAHTPAGSKRCSTASTDFDLGDRDAELIGDVWKVAREIARFVHQIDQVLADHAAHRIGDGERELLGQVIGERRLRRHVGFEVEIAVAPACSGSRPFRIGGGLGGCCVRCDSRPAVVRENVFQVGVEPLLDCGPADLEILSEPLVRPRLAIRFRRRARARVAGASPSPSFARSSKGLRSSSPST